MAATTGETRMLIGGKLVDADRMFDNINPATEEVLGQVSDGTAEDMAAAVAAARQAVDATDWSTDHRFRKECLLQLQAAIEAEREEFRQELIAEVGAPLLATFGPHLDAPLREALTWPAEQIDSFPWVRSLGQKDALGMGMAEREVWKEPMGVVGIIVPWNFPFEIILNKIGPALAMGNAIVLKPAPDTPCNALHLGRIIAEETDIPAGIVNIVTSRDHAVGEVITTSPDVDMVAFTGSTATGRRIMTAAAETLKPVFLELGGKSVHLITADTPDFEGAVGGAAGSCFHSGQGCAIPTRYLVPNSRYDEAVEIAKTAFEAFPYGDPTTDSVLMGPQISAAQRERVLGYIEKGKAEGARVVTGGGPAPQFDKGYFVQPTLFADVDNSMTIAQEEIFGPVVCMIGYDDVDDAVRIANDSTYGLSGVVSAADVEQGRAIAARIKTGTIGINGGVWYGADAPFGGYKQSGIGRQCGIEGLEMFTETKTVGLPV